MYYLEKKKKLTDYIFWKEKFLIRVGGVIEASKTIFFNCFFVCILLIFWSSVSSELHDKTKEPNKLKHSITLNWYQPLFRMKILHGFCRATVIWWYYLGKLHQYITRISLYWCQTFLDGVTSTYWRWVRVLRLSASVALWLWTFLLLVDLSGRVPFKSTFHLSFSICTCDASGVDDSH